MDEVGLDQAAIDETPDTKSDHRLKPQQADQRKADELYADPVHLCIREDRNEQRHAKRQRPREPLLGGSDPLWCLISHEKGSEGSDRTQRCESGDLAQCEIGGNENGDYAYRSIVLVEVGNRYGDSGERHDYARSGTDRTFVDDRETRGLSPDREV